MLNRQIENKNQKIECKLQKNLITMIRKLITSITLVLAISTLGIAQTFEDYVKMRDKQFEDYAKKQDEALKKYADEMDRKLAELDKQWTEYLKKKFIEFETFSKKQPEIGPKPKTKPSIDISKADKTKSQKVEAVSNVEVEEIKQVVTPPLQKKIPDGIKTSTAKFDFYGTPLNIKYPNDLIASSVSKSINEQAISDHFAKLSETPYSVVVNSLLEAKTELNLNDYALYLLTKQTTEKITKDANNAVFLQWFLLMKLGYKAKIGYNESDLYLLIPSAHEIYEKPSFMVDNIRFYLMNGKATSVNTYDKDFPEARQIFNLDLRSPLNLKENNGLRELKFTHAGKTHSMKIEYNKNLINFYNDYPVCDIRVYFDATVSSATKMSLAQYIKPLVKDLSEEEAAALLIKFVQTAFEYKTDAEQFKREKFFFSEELFHYPYSDCEDRAVLFAYLVREFLNLEVVGMAYNGHMATAVKFNENVSGDYFMRGSDKFIICDPTFVNAPIGMVMPQYASQKAEMIELRSQFNTIDREQQIWQMAMQNGCFRGGNGKDAVTDKEGNIYITGYIAGTAKFDEREFKSFEDSRDMFVARYNPKNELDWVRRYGHRGNESGYSIQIGNEGDIYVACSFNESFNLDYKFLKAKNTGDVAVARFTPYGKVEWVTQIGIEETGLTEPFMFVAQLDTKGKVQPLTVFNQMEEYQSFGLQIAENGSPILTGANYMTAELITTKVSYDAGADFSASEMILAENSKLLADNFHPAVAGLFAALKLINNSAIALHGTEVQKTIDQYNPNFKKTSPVVYESLGVVQFIRNSQGIITIRTDSNTDANFKTLRINNNAKFKVSSFSSGNHQIDVMNGINIGKSIIWYNLNSLKIMKTGDMIVDYDSDHTKIRMDITKDVLQ
jgi:hypothetical protein